MHLGRKGSERIEAPWSNAAPAHPAIEVVEERDALAFLPKAAAAAAGF